MGACPQTCMNKPALLRALALPRCLFIFIIGNSSKKRTAVICQNNVKTPADHSRPRGHHAAGVHSHEWGNRRNQNGNQAGDKVI